MTTTRRLHAAGHAFIFLAVLTDLAGFAYSVLSGDPLPAVITVLVAALPLSVRVQGAPQDGGRA